MTTRYETVLTGTTTGSIASGAASTLSLTLAGSNSNADIKKIKIVPSVVGSGELTKVEIYKKSTCLAADRCFATTNFEGSLYSPKFDDGSGPAELNEGWVCDYEDLDVTAKLNMKLFNNGPSTKTFTYSITYQQVGLSSSGTYTPTLTAVTNVSASTPFVCMYNRVGSIVTVFWTANIDPTAAAPTSTELGMSLPIASNLASGVDLAGAGNCGATPAQTSVVGADTTNDRASIVFTATSVADATHRGSFMYRIL